MKYAGTELTNQPYWNKSKLAQKVYSRSIHWVMKLLCSTVGAPKALKLDIAYHWSAALSHNFPMYNTQNKRQRTLLGSSPPILSISFLNLKMYIVGWFYLSSLSFFHLTDAFRNSSSVIEYANTILFSCLGTTKSLKCRCGVFNLSCCLRTYFLFNS